MNSETRRRAVARPLTGVVLSLLWLAATTTFAQSSSGSITGTVTDASGAIVPGATVTATDPTTNAALTATSNDDGVFVFAQLPPTTYVIAVEKDGFKRTEKTGVVLNAADKLNAGDFVLEIGQVAETVTVQADAGQLQVKTESGERSDLITNTQIKDLALNGRQILDMMRILPGVSSDINGEVSSTVQGTIGSFNVNGTRSGSREIAVDGTSNVNANNRGIHVTVNPDAIQEVKILTSNFQAEYGKASGGFVQIVTKGGTNEFHGTGRYFRRHDSLNANNFFNNSQGLPRPLYRYNYYGYDIGGPVYLPRFGSGGKPYFSGKNRLFFFFSQEYYRQVIPNDARNVRVPTAAERNGDFSATADGNGNRVFVRDPLRTGQCNAASQAACFPGNVIPRNRFYANGQAVLNFYPLPNAPEGGVRYNYTSQNSTDYPRREDIIRIDANITDRTRLTARFINNADEQRLPYGIANAVFNFPLSNIIVSLPGKNASFSLIHSFTPTLTNEFIFGPSDGGGLRRVQGDAATRGRNGISTPLLFPQANPENYVPNFTYGGIPNQTFPIVTLPGYPRDEFNTTYNVTDNLTKVLGSHTLKTGVYYQRLVSERPPAGTPLNSSVNFNNDANNPLNAQHPFANALLGIYNTYTQANNFPNARYVYDNVEGYVQDTWKISSRLTLDYGLRVSYFQPTRDERLQEGFFNPTLFNRSQTVSIYQPVLVGTQRRAISPINRPSTPTVANTLPLTFVGQIVPGSGNLSNGIGQTSQGYLDGAFAESRGPQWAPRAGFAYDVFGDGNTALRGGFGISYERIFPNVIYTAIENPPTVTAPILNYGNLAELGPGGVVAPPNIFGHSPDGEIPNVYSYSLGVQRNIGFNTVIDVAYVGTLGRHLPQARNLNAVPLFTTFTRAAQDPSQYAGGVVPAEEPGLPAVYRQAGFSFTGARALPANLLRPYPGYGNITYNETVGTTNYNALQISANRRFSQSLTFGLAYTFSKTFLTADGDSEITNPFNTRGYDYRLAPYDRTHILVINYVYTTPRLSRLMGDNRLARAVFDNFQISGISQYQSGTPAELALTIQGVNAGQRITGSYDIAPRLNLRQGASLYLDNGQINPDAFVIPAIGNVGPYSRTPLRDPSFFNNDLSVFKNFPLNGEGNRYLQLRAEMFNVFNTTQFVGFNSATGLGVAEANGTFTTGAAIFNNYDRVTLTGNLRPQGSTVRSGQFFGEFNQARNPRIVQLAVKLYF